MKQVKNLFRKLINKQSSVFYSADKINRTFLNKARKSFYEKDKVFYKIFISLEDQDIIYDVDNEKPRIPFYNSLLNKKKILTDPHHFIVLMVRYNFFMLMSLISKSVVDAKYALVCADLFSSKI